MNARFAVPILILLGTGAIAVLALRDRDPASAGPAPRVEESPESSTAVEFPEAGATEHQAAPVQAETAESALLRRQLIDILRQPIVGDDIRERMTRLVARREALDAFLAQLGPAAVALIVDLLLEEPDFLNRRRLILALGEIGSDQATDELALHYWRLKALGEEVELNYTIKALGVVQSPYSFDLLTGMIESPETTKHRWRFVEQLGGHNNSAQAVPTFLRVADSSTEPYFKNRSRAALALKWANDPRAAPDVERLLDSEEDKFVRQALCGTLGDLGDPASLTRLGSVARTDQNYQTRMSAIRAMSRIGGEEARKIIEERRENDEHERVRLEATHALQGMDGSG